MRICLLGECRGSLDEGMRNTTNVFISSLSKNHEVIALDLRDVSHGDFWTSIHDFNPDIIHYLHGPTIKSFILAKIIHIHCKNSKIVMSAMRPILPSLLREIVRLIKPDLVLIQSYESEKLFKHLGVRTEFLPCGVDVHRFKPVSSEIKRSLRKKYSLDCTKFIILHIGSVKSGRNVQILTDLKKDDNQILIVGSSSTGVDPKVHKILQEAGCILWIKYIPHIEELYALSDCYIYPTILKHDFFGRVISDSIEMPLTVLEAMACNLPVIATDFGALSRIFEEGGGLYFVDSGSDITKIIKSVKNDEVLINTCQKILPYTWVQIIDKLEKIYLELLQMS